MIIIIMIIKIKLDLDKLSIHKKKCNQKTFRNPWNGITRSVQETLTKDLHAGNPVFQEVRISGNPVFQETLY